MSTLRVTTLQTTSGVEVYTCKAWVNFNGTGTVAIRAAGNVGSITDSGVGTYTVNITNAFADTNYATVANAFNDGSQRLDCEPGITKTTSSQSLTTTVTTSNTLADSQLISVAFFR